MFLSSRSDSILRKMSKGRPPSVKKPQMIPAGFISRKLDEMSRHSDNEIEAFLDDIEFNYPPLYYEVMSSSKKIDKLNDNMGSLLIDLFLDMWIIYKSYYGNVLKRLQFEHLEHRIHESFSILRDIIVLDLEFDDLYLSLRTRINQAFLLDWIYQRVECFARKDASRLVVKKTVIECLAILSLVLDLMVPEN